jgi:hypothetical protein
MPTDRSLVRNRPNTGARAAKTPSGAEGPQGVGMRRKSGFALRHGYGAYADNHRGAEVGPSFTEKGVTERRIDVNHPHESSSFRRQTLHPPASVDYTRLSDRFNTGFGCVLR